MVTAQIGTVECGRDAVVLVFDELAAAMPSTHAVVDQAGAGPAIRLQLDEDGYLVQVTVGGQGGEAGLPRELRTAALGDGFVHVWAGTVTPSILQPRPGAVQVIDASSGAARGVWVSGSHPLRPAVLAALRAGRSFGYAEYLRQPHVGRLLEAVAGRWGDRALRMAMAAVSVRELERADVLLTLAEGFGRSAWEFDEESQEFRALSASSFATEMAALVLRGDLN